MARSHRTAARAALACALFTPLAALAWQSGADFETQIHAHQFSRADLVSDQCTVKVQLLFDAPAAGYEHEVPARNVYRFHVRMKLDDGRHVVTRVFNNRAPGARAYGYTLDTTADGCWAKQERKLQGIDVEGCRGAGCKPEDFE
jgi:hypothetical protein